MKTDELYQRMGPLATIAKVTLVCGLASFVMAFFNSRFSFGALGFVLVGIGLALLFLKDAFRPKLQSGPSNDSNRAK